jgi:catechol 2,3-dioxygenase
MPNDGIDVADLLRCVPAGDPVPPQTHPDTVMGHVHLHVGDLDRALAFWRDVVGLDLVARMGPVAAFLSAGGYHHHLGMNIWRGAGVPPAPPDAVGLRHWTLVLPGRGHLEGLRGRLAAAGHEVEEREDGLLVRDPDGTAALFRVDA